MKSENINSLQQKCDMVNSTLKESIQKLNLRNMQPGEVIDYNTSFSISDWDNLKNSNCFELTKDDSGEKLVMKEECKECQKVLYS